MAVKKKAVKKKAVKKKVSRKKAAAKKVLKADVVQEVESTADVVIKRVKSGFNLVSDKVVGVAKTVGEVTTDAADYVTDHVPTRAQLMGLLEEIEEAGEKLVNEVSSRFNALRQKVIASEVAAPAKKKTTRKKTAKKKAAKKKAVKKQAAKKKPAKKKVAKKKVGKKKRGR